MTEFRFYNLAGETLARVLPRLLEASLARGWRVAVQAGSVERVEALDADLWTYRDDSFLPHGTDREANAAVQPVLLTAEHGNPNGATVRFLLDRAPIPADPSPYERIVVLFDGDDEEALADARAAWRARKEQGFEVSYWQLDETGRWQQRR